VPPIPCPIRLLVDQHRAARGSNRAYGGFELFNRGLLPMMLSKNCGWRHRVSKQNFRVAVSSSPARGPLKFKFLQQSRAFVDVIKRSAFHACTAAS